MTATKPSLASAHVGSSGFSYPSWRGEFYPPQAKPTEFLRFYADRLPTVELNSTFHRLPAEEQFASWAAQTPPGFAFAVKMTRRITYGNDLRFLSTFNERVRALGERLGPILVRLRDTRPRDDGLLQLMLGSVDPDLRYAFDLRDPSWHAREVADTLAAHGAVRVNDLEAAAPFRYLRLREPPYDDAALERLAASIRAELAAGIPVYAYFKHEDEPTAPHYAARLLDLLER
jgi:uncharacterized protein YecE (DUF72 family)